MPEIIPTPEQAAHPLDLPAMAGWAAFHDIDAERAAGSWPKITQGTRQGWRVVADAVRMTIEAQSLDALAKPSDVHVDWHMTSGEWRQLYTDLWQHTDTPYIARLIEAGKIPAPPAAPAEPKPAPSRAELETAMAATLQDLIDEDDAEPQPAPVLAASPPDRPTAKFDAWMASQGYPSPEDRYDGDEMAAAFEGGITAAVVAYATRHDAQPAPELGTAWRLLDEAREQLAATKLVLQETSRESSQRGEQLAAAVAAHEADIASLTDQRNRVSDTADRLREQLATVLGEFTKSSDGCHARVSQVTLAKRKQTAQMEITDAERKMIGG